jgi:hypothetical protein
MVALAEPVKLSDDICDRAVSKGIKICMRLIEPSWIRPRVSFLSFMDCFRVISWLTLAVVPLLLLVRRFKPAGKAPAAH